MVFVVINSSINRELLLNGRAFYGQLFLKMNNNNRRKGDNNKSNPDKNKKRMVTSKINSGQQPPKPPENMTRIDHHLFSILKQ